MKFKSQVFFMFIIGLLSLSLAGCASSGSRLNIVEGKIYAVTSFYPLYDFTKKIGGDHVHALNLIPAGVEPHEWTPKTEDMNNISKADLFIYNGAGFEGWVGDFLDSLDKDAKVKAVEAVKGIQLIEEKGSSDPHVWLSPIRAKQMAANIMDALISIDRKHKQDYEANYKTLAERLDQLDGQYRETISEAPRKEIIVSHEALGYMAKDYGLTQAAVMGLSPEAEPTARDMARISDFAKQKHVKYILFEELVSPKLAKMLANELNIKTLVFNPLEGLTEKEEKAGEDYFSLMEKNLTTLQKALQ